MPRPKFDKGNTASRGRRKGSVNKFTTLKTAFLNVFDRMGGEDELLRWASLNEHNKGLFYQWVTKMLPADVEIGGKDGAPIRVKLEKVITSIDPNGTNRDGD